MTNLTYRRINPIARTTFQPPARLEPRGINQRTIPKVHQLYVVQRRLRRILRMPTMFMSTDYVSTSPAASPSTRLIIFWKFEGKAIIFDEVTVFYFIFSLNKERKNPTTIPSRIPTVNPTRSPCFKPHDYSKDGADCMFYAIINDESYVYRRINPTTCRPIKQLTAPLPARLQGGHGVLLGNTQRQQQWGGSDGNRI